MSTTSTGGSGAPSTRCGQAQPRAARATDSGRGVALPATQHGARVARRALGRDVAGVVARVALVLVGGVVLLVDDDEPEVGQRREDGRARPDADARLARAQARPLVVALAGRQRRVQDGDGVAEARRRSARRSAASARSPARARSPRARAASVARGGAQVDLGLARAGHAVQQQPLARRRRRDRRRAPRPGRPVSGGARRARAPTATCGRRAADDARLRCATSPRASSRRRAARSGPAKRGSVASSARWRSSGARSSSGGAARARPQRRAGARALAAGA